MDMSIFWTVGFTTFAAIGLLVVLFFSAKKR